MIGFGAFQVCIVLRRLINRNSIVRYGLLGPGFIFSEIFFLQLNITMQKTIMRSVVTKTDSPTLTSWPVGQYGFRAWSNRMHEYIIEDNEITNIVQPMGVQYISNTYTGQGFPTPTSFMNYLNKVAIKTNTIS